MATVDQLTGNGGGRNIQPLRPTTLSDPFASLRAEQFKIREQERYLDEVGLNTKPRVTGAPAVYDFAERDEAYAKKKLDFAQASAWRQWVFNRTEGNRR